MTNRFFAGQADYIEQLNALDVETGDHIADTAGAHAATAISNTPAGNIAATTVQAAINELDTEKLSASATTLPASFTASSLTSVGTLTALTVTGSVGVGGAAFASAKLMLTGTAPASGTLSFGHYNGLTLDPAVTSSAYLNYTVPAIATGGTVGTLAHYFVAQGVFTGTATNQYGFAVGSAMTGATNNFGFHSAIASGANRWNFYAAGTAANYFQGDTTFASQAIFAAGSAAAPSVKVGAEQNGLYSSAANTLDVTLNGVRQAQFSYTAAAVNYPRFTGSTTGNEVRLSVQGTDTNAGMWVTTKGTGVIRLETGGGEQVRVSHTAAAVNYLNLTGSATGNYVGFAAAGSDTNIGITYTAKGNVSHDFYANNGIQFRVNGSIANATNYFEFFGQAAGSSPLLRSYSPTDSNVNARYRTQGAGSHQFETGSSGNIGLLVAHTASSVNYGQFTGNSAGGYPSLRAAGSDTNIGFDFATQGAAPFRFYTNAFGAEQLRIAHVASAVNYAQITGSATGGNVTYGVAGSDTNISKEYRTKGAGFHLFTTNTGQVQLQITHTASAVNYAQITGSATGLSVVYGAAGIDANVSTVVTGKGASSVGLYSNSGLNAILFASHVASSVNYWNITGAATGGLNTLTTQGSDANIGAYLATKGTGTWRFATGGGDQVRITDTASAVNRLELTGSATGNAVTISTGGSDTNRSLSLTAAGTGLVQITNDSLRIVTSKTPASAAATGTQGQIAWDSSYIYVCTATDTWKRAALATW